MGFRTTFICDHCKGEWDQKPGSSEFGVQKVFVGLNFNFGNHYAQDHCKFGQTWCRPCVMKLGIHEPVTKEDKQVAPETPLSFEEKLATMLEELGFNRSL